MIHRVWTIRAVRRRDLWLVAAGLGVAGLEALSYAGLYLSDRGALPWTSLLWYLVATASWAPFYPLVVRWTETDLAAGLTRRRQALRHLARALLVTSALSLSLYGLRNLARLLFGGPPFPFRQVLDLELAGGLIADLIVYGALVGGTVAVAISRQLRAREVEASRLEAALAQTELRLLKAQLDPHFLFNTLHAITAQIHADPAVAEAMTCRLSDFLRVSLAADGVQQVTLASELEHLQSYVEIQRLRFRGRFDARLEIEPEALAGLMPSLLLQPLVENVVKHGVAVRAEPVHAVIRAGRRGGRLRLEIEDDGPGLAPGPPAAGIGLANTRARLAKLYGGDQRLELENLAAGGLLVVVELPWQEADAAPRPATFGAFPSSFLEGAPGSRRGSCAFSASALESFCR